MNDVVVVVSTTTTDLESEGINRCQVPLHFSNF